MDMSGMKFLPSKQTEIISRMLTLYEWLARILTLHEALARMNVYSHPYIHHKFAHTIICIYNVDLA